jgi:hypothetical protein
MPFRHDVVAEAGCIGIFAILINTLYLKNNYNNTQKLISTIFFGFANLILLVVECLDDFISHRRDWQWKKACLHKGAQ